METTIEEAGMTLRTENVLRNAGFFTLEKIASHPRTELYKELYANPYCGKKCLREIDATLERFGLQPVPPWYKFCL
jgi:DNA-directed RNA polymerase alpha subunit